MVRLFLASFLCLIPQIHGAPTQEAAKCTHPRIRKEWRALTPAERITYTSAVKCLKTIPAKGKAVFPAINRYDDFAGTHIMRTGPVKWNGREWDGVKPGIHNTGIFLPWHRYFVWRYESALISECGYNGAHPYWDWSLDAELDSLKTSPVFDPVTGFGGDGVNVTDSVIPGLNGRCVIDGPFAGLSVNFGKGPPPNNTIKAEKRCLNRVLNDWTIKRMGWDKAVVPLLNYSTYDQFQNRINYGEDGYGSGLHPNGHSAVGGEMADEFSSVNDPLFFMHHANIDRLWWMWQEKHPERVFDVDGPYMPWGVGPGGVRSDVKTNLSSLVELYPFVGATVPAKKIMDTLNRNGEGDLCYTYL